MFGQAVGVEGKDAVDDPHAIVVVGDDQRDREAALAKEQEWFAFFLLAFF